MYDECLGDGVYASWVGFGIALDLRGQDTTTKIVMEPNVLDAFDKYRAYLRAIAEVQAKIDCNKSDSYYISRHVATVAERVIAALKDAKEEA